MSATALQETEIAPPRRRWSRYPGYKATGIPWLSGVPDHWEVNRLRWTIHSARNGVWGSEPDGANDIPCVRVADFDRVAFRVNDDVPTIRSVTASERRGRILSKGDLLLEKSGGGELQPVGAVAIYASTQPAICSNFLARLIPASNCCGRFLSYLHAHLYSARVNVRSIKQTTGIQNLDAYSYFCEQVPLPPLDEQRVIAAFLDRETARIDALIEKKERLLRLNEERLRAAITLQTSNASASSKSVRLGFFVDLLPGFAFKSESFSQASDDIPLLRGINVSVGRTDWTEVVRWDRYDADAYSSFALQEGDLVLGMDRPWVSTGIRVTRIKQSDLPCLLLQRVARLRSTNGLLQDYLELLLNSAMFRAYFEPILTGVSVPHISPDQIKGFRFVLPGPAEQKKRIESLRSLSVQADSLKAEGLKGINRLREYRSALVTAAVTGQIDVRNYEEAPCP